MFISVLSSLLCAWFAYLLPSFYTFKALSHGMAQNAELVRWGKYWTVVGTLVATEHVLEWFISWFPFYWEVKTLFLLYLSLPQTEGSTYIYDTQLQPFFSKNEAQLDAGIINIQRVVFSFVQDRLSRLVELIGAALNKSGASQSAATGQPALSLDTVRSLWQTYGAAFMGGAQSQKKDVPTTAASTAVQPTVDNNVAQRGPPSNPPAPPPITTPPEAN